jgi:hypothetical protein
MHFRVLVRLAEVDTEPKGNRIARPLSCQGRDKLAWQFAGRGEQALRDDDAGEFRPRCGRWCQNRGRDNSATERVQAYNE